LTSTLRLVPARLLPRHVLLLVHMKEKAMKEEIPHSLVEFIAHKIENPLNQIEFASSLFVYALSILKEELGLSEKAALEIIEGVHKVERKYIMGMYKEENAEI
jgi:signal transduction histidine kinase